MIGSDAMIGATKERKLYTLLFSDVEQFLACQSFKSCHKYYIFVCANSL